MDSLPILSRWAYHRVKRMLFLLGWFLLLSITGRETLAATTHQPPMALVWRTEVLDSRSAAYPALALDANGAPHVAYSLYDAIVYRRWTGSQWLSETVAQPTMGDLQVGPTALTLDSQGQPHLSGFTCNMFYCRALYASRIGDQWTIDLPIPGDDALALDGNDRPHLSYNEGNVVGSIQFKYAYWTGSAWISTTLVSNLPTGAYSSLQLDDSDAPHLSHNAHGHLTYAYLAGSSWITQAVEGSGNTVGENALALDNTGQPHISYYDGDQQALRYAVLSGGQWTIQTVDHTGKDASSALALDSQGRPHIAYYHQPQQAFKYAYWTGNTWQIYTIGHSTFAAIELALDANDLPRLVYIQASASDSVITLAWGELPQHYFYLPLLYP